MRSLRRRQEYTTRERQEMALLNASLHRRLFNLTIGPQRAEVISPGCGALCVTSSSNMKATRTFVDVCHSISLRSATPSRFVSLLPFETNVSIDAVLEDVSDTIFRESAQQASIRCVPSARCGPESRGHPDSAGRSGGILARFLQRVWPRRILR
jgi:hypothetical protein